MAQEVKTSLMSFQMLSFGNDKTREKPCKKHLNETYVEKTAERVVQLFWGIDILEYAVKIPLKC